MCLYSFTCIYIKKKTLCSCYLCARRVLVEVRSHSPASVHSATCLFRSPEMEAPYSSEEEKMRLLDLYRYMHGRMHSTSRPLKLIYHVAERETLLAWVGDCRELQSAC